MEITNRTVFIAGGTSGIARRGGTIVTVSSGIGFLPFPLMATYGATKAAVHSYTESLPISMAPASRSSNSSRPPSPPRPWPSSTRPPCQWTTTSTRAWTC